MNANRHVAIVISTLCLVTVLFFSGCVKMPEEQHTSYETLTLSRETVTAPLTWSASIRGTGDVSIVSRCTGTLNEIKAKDGQSVKKGDVLFLIDSRIAENALVHAKADLQTAIANRDNARLEAESNKELAEQGIISDYLSFFSPPKRKWRRLRQLCVMLS